MTTVKENEIIQEEVQKFIEEVQHNTETQALLDPIVEQEDRSIVSQTRYVLGFAFTEDKDQVLLIKKNRPIWQAGLLNGIGGKIEHQDESSCHAMEREFIEETGLIIPSHQWRVFAHMESPAFHITVYWSVSDNLHKYENTTDEEVSLVRVEDLFKSQFSGCISNLSWLIGMAVDKDIERMHNNTHYFG